jgi:RNA polymerase sigma-70 factor (ECF subfamily)
MTEDRSAVDRFLRTRSDEAFRALYGSHAPVMYRLVVRLLGREGADAEDALQDAWIRAAGQLERFRWDSSLRTWLCGIAVNCCRERLRRGMPFTGPAPESAHVTSPARPWQSIDLERAIARLPSGGRAVFVLHDIQGYTHDEIGRLLDIEPSSSRSQLVRARRALRAMLAPSDATGDHPWPTNMTSR